MDVNVSNVKFLVGAFVPKAKKTPPYPFLLDALDPLCPETRPMFGCLAVYIGPKILLILRDKRDGSADDGVWLATTQDHHESLRLDFPNRRSIQVWGKQITGWQILPADSPDLENAALRACELILHRDPRIGKIPKPKLRKPQPL